MAATTRTMTARRTSECPGCGGTMTKGETIVKASGARYWTCQSCAAPAAEATYRYEYSGATGEPRRIAAEAMTGAGRMTRYQNDWAA
jgi:ribosomal protein L37AE/L43A